MSKVDTIQTSFTTGELAPSLFGRTDIAQYQNACAIVENMLIRPYGSLISTPGTEYINACKTGGSTSTSRLLQFIFSKTDAYIIEMGDSYFRFYTNGAVVVSPGTTPYEISHTYTAAQIPDIQYAQINDIIYLVHPSHPPRKLTRSSSTSWSLTALPFTGGPFAPDNYIYSNSTTLILTSATITPSGTNGSITLSATSNIFIASGSTLGHLNTFWKINALVTNSTTGLQEQGYAQITAITNPSTATATVIKQLKSATATTIWAQGSWSDVLGWPGRITFHEQRLMMARTSYQPQTIWGSQTFSYENFAINGGADDDALDITIAANESNQINWIASADSLIAGTYGGDFSIRSGDGSPLTPSNTNSVRISSWGSEPIVPKRIGNFLYYVQRFARKLREFFYDSYLTQNNKSADETILSPHIAGTGFKEFAYQQNPDTVLWAVCSNGTIATLTREIDQEVHGWSRQTTDGYYESIASIPSASLPHDEVWVIVRRSINGSTVRYIERFKSQLVPDRQDQCFYVHCGLTYDAYNATSTPTSTSMSFTYPNAITKLLLHCDGINESTTFTDSSGAKTVTASGSTQISTSIKKFGTGSAYIPNVSGIDSYTKLLLHLDNNVTDSGSTGHTASATSITYSSTVKELGGYSAVFNGASSYISVPDNADWNFGSGDFTIETWVNFNRLPSIVGNSANIYTQRDDDNNAILFNVNSSDAIRFILVSSSTTLANYSYTWTPSKDLWYHLALVRNGSSLYLFIDGTLTSWSTTSTAISTSSVPNFSAAVEIGGRSDTSQWLDGYLDEYRVSKGIARWTSSFTPPNFPYATPNDALVTADHADWYFGTGDFTIDGWVYHNDLTDAYVLAGQYADANNYWYVGKGTNSAGNKLQLYFRSSSSDKANYVMASSSSLAISSWTHLAYVRSSSTVKIYINGVSQALTATTPISTNDVGNISASLVIGQQNTTSLFKGYIDEFRVTKGSPLWTADFTPPTSAGTQSGTVALITSSAAYFSAGNVGKRIRAIDSDGAVLGEMTISGYTSSTIVVGSLTQDFDAFSYAAGFWGVSVSSITGLSHLEGETVSVLSDGTRDSPNKIVSSGSISLVTDAFYVNVGLPYTQKIQTLPQEAATQRGTAQGKLQRINQLGIKVNNSYSGFSIGPDESSLDTLTAISPSLYTGTIANVFYKGGYSYGAQVWIENSAPLPIELLSLITTIDTQEK